MRDTSARGLRAPRAARARPVSTFPLTASYNSGRPRPRQQLNVDYLLSNGPAHMYVDSHTAILAAAPITDKRQSQWRPEFRESIIRLRVKSHDSRTLSISQIDDSEIVKKRELNRILKVYFPKK